MGENPVNPVRSEREQPQQNFSGYVRFFAFYRDAFANDGSAHKGFGRAGKKLKHNEYIVLARRYRPSRFDGLIGQDVLVQTLTNALKLGRLHHAFMLTGLRGVGKTTSARIIAQVLNCSDRKENDPEPCGACENCQAVLGGRHMDVIEMDAASHTGVDDIRDIISAVAYAPVQGKKKVYIIDEVHMLSKNAFNALLKTLEEPPEHVVFIFATTEIRRVPATIISRCQRFDLRRVDLETLSAHFKNILEKEKISADQEALHMIARAADGSVRDGLSLLDQAIAKNSGHITAASIEKMLHLNDRQIIFDLFDAIIEAKGAEAVLTKLHLLYDAGADPLQLARDLLEWVHMVTRLKVAPEIGSLPWLGQSDRVKGKEVADKLPTSLLMRFWQILLKGEAEIRGAPEPLQALEMLLLRLIHGAALPVPDFPETSEASEDLPSEPPSLQGHDAPAQEITARVSTALVPEEEKPQAQKKTLINEAMPVDFDACLALFEKNNELRHARILSVCSGLIDYRLGKIELMARQDFASDFSHESKEVTGEKIAKSLTRWTGQDWQVVFSDHDKDVLSWKQRKEQAHEEQLSLSKQDPAICEVFDLFPGAILRDVERIEDQD